MSKHQDSSINLGFWFAFGATALFALKSIFIKFAYLEGLDATAVLTWRMAMALPLYALIGAWLWHFRPQQRPEMNFRVLLVIFALGFMGYYLSSYLDLLGLELITAQLERLTLYTMPIFVTLLGIAFFKEPFSWGLIVALGLASLGMVVFYQAEINYSGDDTLKGVLLVMGAAFSFALYLLFSKRYIHRTGSLWFTILAMSASSLFVVIQGTATHSFDANTVTLAAWGWILALVVLSTILPSFMMAEALKRIGAAKSGIMGTLGPVLTIGFAIVWLNEPFGWHQAAGSLLILLAIYWLKRFS